MVYLAEAQGIKTTNTAAQNATAAIALSTKINANGGGRIVFPALGEYLFDTTSATPFSFNACMNVVMEGVAPGTTVLQTSGTRLKRSTGTGLLVQWTGTGDTNQRALGGARHIEFHGGGLAGNLVWINRPNDMNFDNVLFTQSLGTVCRITQAWNCTWKSCHFNYSGSGRATPAMLMEDYSAESTVGLGGSAVNHFIGCEWEGNTGTDIRLTGASTTGPCLLTYFTGCKQERQIAQADWPVIDGNYADGAIFVGTSFNIGGSIANYTGTWSGAAAGSNTITTTANVAAGVVNGTMLTGPGLPVAINALATWDGTTNQLTVTGQVPSSVTAGMSVRAYPVSGTAAAGISANTTISSIGSYNSGSNTTPITLSAVTTVAQATAISASFGGAWVTGGQGSTSLTYTSTSATTAGTAQTVVTGGAISRILETPATTVTNYACEFAGVWFQHNGAPDYLFAQQGGTVIVDGAQWRCNNGQFPVRFWWTSVNVGSDAMRWSACQFSAAWLSILDDRTTVRNTSLGFDRVHFPSSSAGVVVSQIGSGSYFARQLRHSNTDALYEGAWIVPQDFAVGTAINAIIRYVAPFVDTNAAHKVRWQLAWNTTGSATNLSTVSPNNTVVSGSNVTTAYGTQLASVGLGSFAFLPGSVLAFTLSRLGSDGNDTLTDTVGFLYLELNYTKTK